MKVSSLLLLVALLLLSGATVYAQDEPHAPVPETARGVGIDFEKGYALEEVAEGVYWVTNGSTQVIFLTTGDGVVVVDAPPDIGENYLRAIAEVTDEPVTHVIYSHAHQDHIGSGVFGDDVTYVAHEATAQLLEQANDANRPLPDITFSDEYVLEVGNQTIEVSYQGNNHEPGNIFIYLPEHRILTVIDVVWVGWVPFSYLGLAEDVPGFYRAYEQILDYDFDIFVGGHVGRYGSREDVETGLAYLNDVRAASLTALQSVDLYAIANEYGFENPWLTLDVYFNALAETCAEIVEPAWVDRLGGADVWTRDNCYAVVQSLRID